MEQVYEDVTAKPAPVKEVEIESRSGLAMLAGAVVMAIAAVVLIIVGAAAELILVIPLAVLLIIAAILVFAGLFTVGPNEGKVLQLFGSYRGTVRDAGLRWANPFYTKRGLSLRVRNFESGRLKVNDFNGNPIEIAAVVVWKVHDTAEALFQVDNYEQFVRVQSEAALRNLSTRYPYDAHDAHGVFALRSHTIEIAEELRAEIQERLERAGVEVIEARISHLAYAPEIAGVMLQRQQADAVVAARQKIVEGAVGMVEMALGMLSAQNIVHLDEARKAAMVSNLLVVLCGDRGTQPIVNAGEGHD